MKLWQFYVACVLCLLGGGAFGYWMCECRQPPPSPPQLIEVKIVQRKATTGCAPYVGRYTTNTTLVETSEGTRFRIRGDWGDPGDSFRISTAELLPN